MKNMKTRILSLLVAATIIPVAACAAESTTDGLMNGVTPNRVEGRPADTTFTESMADFSIELFKQSITNDKNSLISPLSVMLALAMTANGADGETLVQMEKLLGGGIPLDELNEYLYSYVQRLPNEAKAKLNIANSIWFRDDGDRLQVEADFLQRNADYYGAAAFRSAFDSQTVKDINNWVESNTDGMIDKMLDEIDSLAMLFLINAVLFDAEWQNVYNTYQVSKDDFTEITGTIRNVDFMYSAEYIYLEDDMATGFLKPYAGDRYSFAALLPNADIPLEAYVDSLTGAGFLETMNNAQNTLVSASMPKFEFDYNIGMNDALIALGIPNAFDMEKAAFGKMGTSADGPLYISTVLHKTFITVDELGTKAGAVTMVAAAGGIAQEPKIVNLDRPFVFAIIDNKTKLPIFIGVLLSPY